MAESKFMHPTPSTTVSPAPQCLPRADGPSPTKRRKVTTSRPKSIAPTDPSSASIIVPNPQLDAERGAAAQRVLDVWSALEDKYARRLEEDDIIDLRTGGLVRDRGVLSGTTRMWNFGCFADAVEDSGAEPEEGSEDELGGWGSGSEIDHQFKPIYVPPVQELNPEDAQDLRDFLAAEEKRRAFDDDEDGVSFDEPREDEDGTDNYGLTETDLDNDGSIVDVEAGSALVPSDEDSPDELEGYDDTVGEGALLWEVRSDEEEVRSDAEHPLTPAPPIPPLRRLHTPAQLRTPPLSRSSDIPRDAPTRKPGNRSETELLDESKSPSPKRGRKESGSSFLTPTKKLIPEVFITSRRRASIVKAHEPEERPTKAVGQPRGTSSHSLKKPPIPTKRKTNEPSPSKPVSETSAKSHKVPATPKRLVKRKRKLSVDEGSEQSEEDEEEEEKVPVPLRQNRHKLSPYSPSSASPAPTNFWSPYSRHNSVAPPYPGSFTPMHQPTPLDTQLIFAQVMQSLSYFMHPSPEGSSPGWAQPAPFLPSQRAHPPGPSHWPSPYSLPGPSHPPPPPPTPSHVRHSQQMPSQIPPPRSHRHRPSPQHTSSRMPPPLHTPSRVPSLQHTPSRIPPPHHTPPHSHPRFPSPPPPPRPSSYPSQEPLPHSPLFFPPYPYPYPYSHAPDVHTHPQPPPSSASSFGTEPPSSPNSSPLSGKGKGKRVWFPDELYMPKEDEGEDGKRGESPLKKAQGSSKKTAASNSTATAGNWMLSRDSGESFKKKKSERALGASSGSGSGLPSEPGSSRSKSKFRK